MTRSPIGRGNASARNRRGCRVQFYYVRLAPPFQLGEVLQGGAVGEVVASEYPGFKPGDLVSSMFGWREWFNAPVSTVEKLDTLRLPPQAFLGVAGVTGLTAWVAF